MSATPSSGTPAGSVRRSSRRKPLATPFSSFTDGSDADYDSSSAAESGLSLSTGSLRAASAARKQNGYRFEGIDELDGELATPSPSPDGGGYSSAAPTLVMDESSFDGGKEAASTAMPPPPARKPRGRPRKASVVAAATAKASGESAAPVAKKAEAAGGEPQADPKVDTTGMFEFGGSVGVLAMMIGFPLLMWYMWIGATFYGGKVPLPAEGESAVDFAKHLYNLVYTGGFPTLKAWATYWAFFIFEGMLYCLAPGVWAYGKPLPHLGGQQLKYYCSAYVSFYTTIVVTAALHVSGIYPLYTILDEFGSLLTVSIISGFIVAFLAYFSALYRGAQHRMTGYPIYDFFMGAELNPRMFGILDFKMFFEVRFPWYVLFLLSCATAARQYERYGYVSGEVAFVVMAHYLYANACSKGEELIVTTWDMYYEKWGFMLIFWNMAGVPLSYCHCTLYLANHEPAEYRWNPYVLGALFSTYIFVYWVWDSCNSQKNRFRAEERGTLLLRNTFPQVPWQTVKNPKVIKTATGDSILADGWYGKARKVHYACDMFFSLSWGLVTGFSSPFPWFYPLFFSAMITHRALRDIERCRAKYGDAWMQYEKQVPYLFIPYVF